MAILVIDVGGSKLKALASGASRPRKAPSGPDLTPDRMVERVLGLVHGWAYDAVSIGFPGPVGDDGPAAEPGNLGDGWVGFDFAGALGRPVRLINDAAMQALGSYQGGRMLFLGLGTGVGSTLIAERVVVTLELGRVPAPGGGTLGEALGRAGLERMGEHAWRSLAIEWALALRDAFRADEVVLGGGNGESLAGLPPGLRAGANRAAFLGGFRLWDDVEDVPTQLDGGAPIHPEGRPAAWRVL